MAIMIPEYYSPDIKSTAEKRVFEWFKAAPNTDDWIVLHSLGISRHQKLIHGEIDFLVLAPGLGMYALEVKGGRVERRLGKWRFINRDGEYSEKVRGPFDQAWEGIYSVRGGIKAKRDTSHRNLDRILFGIGVLFPDIEYDAVGSDEEPWQVFDINDGKDVGSFIRHLYTGSLSTRERLDMVDLCTIPTSDDVRYIADLLRGDFARDVPLKIKQKYTEDALVNLTAEQASCLEQLSDNPRTLIRGTAGTGKTLLALEAAKRAVTNGEKVALFCFNRMLGEWLNEYFEDYPLLERPIFVGTFHSFLARLLISQGVDPGDPSKEKRDSDYFNETVPRRALELDPDRYPQYDRIIVDEAQDLITEDYLRIMDLSLKGGLFNGSFIMFGDFSMQSIYSDKVSESRYIDDLQEWTSFTLFRLTRNCRNTKKICIDIENIVGIPENAAFEEAFDTPAVEHVTYDDNSDQKTKLVRILSELLAKDIKPKDIVILSPKRRQESVVSLLDGITVRNYSVKETQNIRFSTIHAFKGLESSAIIITDVNSYHDEKLMYTGLSRARFYLHILETKNAQDERTDLFFRRRLQDVR